MSVSRKTLLSKEVMAVEAIKIDKVTAAPVVDTADTAASTRSQVLAQVNNHHQVHPEPPARPITAHNMLNIMVPVLRIPTQLMEGTQITSPIINNITPSKPHSNQLHRGPPPLRLHREMNLRLHPLQAAPLLPPMAAITR